MTLEIGILAKEKLIELVIQEGVLKAEDGRHLFQLSYQELDLIYKGMKNITA
ncbi:Fur-regulated basic protein FbpA [Bacillus sp. 2205SS5-2]|uniref:Fur-regulated basic protein FbpA n=1 Tax=Bacillus sp. 2205SS5-2 TaxID=3109031 RepID=UPI003006C535